MMLRQKTFTNLKRKYYLIYCLSMLSHVRKMLMQSHIRNTSDVNNGVINTLFVVSPTIYHFILSYHIKSLLCTEQTYLLILPPITLPSYLLSSLFYINIQSPSVSNHIILYYTNPYQYLLSWLHWYLHWYLQFTFSFTVQCLIYVTANG